MTTDPNGESGISALLRKIRRHGEVDLPENDEPVLDLNEVADELASAAVSTEPLHKTLYDELSGRRRTLISREAQLVAEINLHHEDLASIRMAIGALEASMLNLNQNPIEAKRELNLTELRQQKATQ